MVVNSRRLHLCVTEGNGVTLLCATLGLMYDRKGGFITLMESVP